MSLAEGFPPLGDPGGGSSTYIDGSYTGATLPTYMDPKGDHGELAILKLEPVHGKLPDHPFILRASIERWINGKIDRAIPEARGQAYALKVRGSQQLERLMEMKQLSDGTAVRVTKHPVLNSVRCVISCNELTKIEDDEEIVKHLSSQNVSGIRRIK